MKIDMEPIGICRTEAKDIPRHWSVSDVLGALEIKQQFLDGIKGIRAGDIIVVIFIFHKSPKFSQSHLIQKPPHRNVSSGVFSICSPIRPNPIGMSILKVIKVDGCTIYVKGIDMIDGTPILDIKPYRAA